MAGAQVLAKQSDMTIGEKARAVGINRRTLARHFEAGLSRTATVPDIIAWRAANVRQALPMTRDAAAMAGDDDPQTVSEARLILLRNQGAREKQLAERYTMENAKRRGELLEAEAVERDLAVALSKVRNRLLGLGLSCANVAPAEMKPLIKGMVDEAVRNAMRELSGDFEAMGVETEHTEG